MTSIGKDLRGAVVVVMGASSGFGRGAALKLGKAGASVIVAARRGDLLSQLEAEIASSGGNGLAVECDVSRADDVAAVAAAAVQSFGRIDVWINNVGVGALGLFWDIPVDDQARVIDVNLKGLMFGAHAALTQFRRQGSGVLINVGSIDSEVPLAYQAIYAATKAGVLSLSRSLNQELRLAGLNTAIKVATIMPWAVDTPWWLHAANHTGHQPRMAAMDDPEIVVDAILEACTDPREEMPVGSKARVADISHRLFPGLTERLSADVVAREVGKGASLPATSGSLHVPMAGGSGIDGGIRARMKVEDEREKPVPPHPGIA